MLRLLVVLALLLPSTALAANIIIVVPDAVLPDLAIGCTKLKQIHRSAENTTNPECGGMLLRMGLEALIERVTVNAAQKTMRNTISARTRDLFLDWPTPLRDAVCGDGNLDSTAGEQCDDGGSNSDTVADACRTTCGNASCGDGVVDTGETCDDGQTETTCKQDCSGPL